MEIRINPFSSRKANMKFTFILFVSIFFLIGIALIYFFSIKYTVMNYQVRSSWEQVPCKIVSLGIESKEGRSSHGWENWYWLSGEFTYEYKGDNYASKYLNFQSGYSEKMTNIKGLLEKQLDKYHSMTNPVCYVNPERPREALLDPTLTPTSIFFNWIGLGVIAFSALLAIIFYKVYQKECYKDTIECQECQESNL